MIILFSRSPLVYILLIRHKQVLEGRQDRKDGSIHPLWTGQEVLSRRSLGQGRTVPVLCRDPAEVPLWAHGPGEDGGGHVCAWGPPEVTPPNEPHQGDQNWWSQLQEFHECAREKHKLRIAKEGDRAFFGNFDWNHSICLCWLSISYLAFALTYELKIDKEKSIRFLKSICALVVKVSMSPSDKHGTADDDTRLFKGQRRKGRDKWHR